VTNYCFAVYEPYANYCYVTKIVYKCLWYISKGNNTHVKSTGIIKKPMLLFCSSWSD